MKKQAPEQVPRTVRRHPFPREVKAPVYLYPNDGPLKAHPLYVSAKGGDPTSALGLVLELALTFLQSQEFRFPPDVIFVAPHAREAGGDNAIPQVLADVCAAICRAEVDTEIVQVSRVYHTGADPMERMSLRAAFEGEVRQGLSYVLVDDVTNMGGTLAELANYIQNAGGSISGALVLVNAGRSKQFHPDSRIVRKIDERYGHDILEIFGIQPAALTANEASYLIGFRSADEIRNRLAKARQETNLRLRSKGIIRPAE